MSEVEFVLCTLDISSGNLVQVLMSIESNCLLLLHIISHSDDAV